MRIRSIKDYLIGIEHIQRNALTATTNSLPRLPPPQASVLKIFNNSLRKAKAEAAPLVNEDGRNDDDDPMMLMMLGGNTESAGGGGGEEPGGGGGAPSAEVYDGEEEQKDSGGSGSQDQQELRETGSAAHGRRLCLRFRRHEFVGGERETEFLTRVGRVGSRRSRVDAY